MVDDGLWVCLCIEGRVGCDDKFDVEAEVMALFGSEADSILVVSAGEGECYALVRCLDYFKFSEAVRSVRWVLSVLDSYDTPTFLTDAEVADFVDSFQVVETGERLRIGSMVTVQKGYLVGLCGIVVACFKDTSDVLFRFNTVDLTRTLTNGALLAGGNVFDLYKVPVLSDLGPIWRVPVSASSRKRGVDSDEGGCSPGRRNRHVADCR